MGWLNKIFRKEAGSQESIEANNSGGASDSSIEKNTQAGTMRLSETSLEYADGIVIPLADIKEVSAPEVFIGHPNHPLTRAIQSELSAGHGVVYLVYVTKDGAATKVIPTVDRSAAVALAQQIKDAKAAANKQTSDRVIVGECEQCHRPLRVKSHAVRAEMVLTCKCGQQNRVHVSTEG
jgi:hypothetical protein